MADTPAPSPDVFVHPTSVIDDDVEIGAQVAIDRPAIGETRIKAGAKVDNLVQIGHAVRVGRNALLAAPAGIAGSTTLQDDARPARPVGVNAPATARTGHRAARPQGPPRPWLRGRAVRRPPRTTMAPTRAVCRPAEGNRADRAMFRRRAHPGR